MIQLKLIAVLFWLTLVCNPITASAQQLEDDSLIPGPDFRLPPELLAEFEVEADRRREAEGENFDEAAYQFEKEMMDRRSQLDEMRIAIEEEFKEKRQQLESSGGGQNPAAWQALDEAQQQRHEELEAQYQALERDSQEYWDNRQREDQDRQREEVGNQREEFEAEADRRRDEEGENFDEAAYQFEKEMMDHRSQLDEMRIAIEEEFEEKRQQLESSGGGQNPAAWQALDEAQQQRHEELEAQYQALKRDSQEYWDNRQREDQDREAREEMGNQREEFEAETDRPRSEEGENFDEEARGKLMVLAREHIGLPQVSGAEQNYPNPFNGATTIAYHVKQPGLVRLEVYDISGQRVRELTSGFHATGSYRAVWDGHDASGRNAASGVYFYALRVGGMHEVKKMLYVK